MLQLERDCYSIVELEISCEKETCIHVELFLFDLGIVLYINRLFVINETHNFSYNYF